MNRRQFAATLGAAVAGIVAGRTLLADDKPAAKAKDKGKEHVCAGKNECKGQGGCHSKDNACGGQNACKGKGGCASASMRHECEGKNECKGHGGCKSGDGGCRAKNTCKGKGGCAVPLKKEHADKPKAG
jgi:hypothetical protein